MVYAYLIKIFVNILRINVCHIEPIIAYDSIIVYQIKATLGITGLFFWRVLINKSVWHLDVGLS